jgi:hypothetical protein
MALRFPPSWTVEKIPGGFKVYDANGQSLAYVYSRENPNDAQIAGVLTEDEAMSPKTTPMQASAAGAQVRAVPAWATVPVFAVALMKSVPSLFIKYRKYGHLSSEAAVIFQRRGAC